MAGTHSRGQPQRAGNTDTLGERIIAYFIDSFVAGAIFGALAFLGVILGGLLGDTGGSIVLASMILVASVAAFGYKIYFEANGGQPLGKQLMNVAVVMDDGRECTWGAAIIRNLLLGFEGGLIAVVVILVTDEDQRIGDLLGSTVVVEA